MIRFISLSAIAIAWMAFVNIQTKAAEGLPDAVTTNPEAYDVVVVGGTPAGVAAAIAAGRHDAAHWAGEGRVDAPVRRRDAGGVQAAVRDGG